MSTTKAPGFQYASEVQNAAKEMAKGRLYRFQTGEPIDETDLYLLLLEFGGQVTELMDKLTKGD
ncbi:hypothetical protein [Candidatus Contubernalis alkaliaceticus]|uniref:hypothetical protein n=1 Tax=Candidatus Contubernalis alkaliaceticus TaxID=338645 RepID=UPI001F4C02E6|nr:hypothetical protein [Candidatus Contubernalis alkalaceticus]UNC91668.1 hypothetical protein HUE98_05915 [Candidatus Contubernalis alkalaceticus]